KCHQYLVATNYGTGLSHLHGLHVIDDLFTCKTYAILDDKDSSNDFAHGLNLNMKTEFLYNYVLWINLCFNHVEGFWTDFFKNHRKRIIKELKNMINLISTTFLIILIKLLSVIIDIPKVYSFTFLFSGFGWGAIPNDLLDWVTKSSHSVIIDRDFLRLKQVEMMNYKHSQIMLHAIEYYFRFAPTTIHWTTLNLFLLMMEDLHYKNIFVQERIKRLTDLLKLYPIRLLKNFKDNQNLEKILYRMRSFKEIDSRDEWKFRSEHITTRSSLNFVPAFSQDGKIISSNLVIIILMRSFKEIDIGTNLVENMLRLMLFLMPTMHKHMWISIYISLNFVLAVTFFDLVSVSSATGNICATFFDWTNGYLNSFGVSTACGTHISDFTGEALY
ncbi:hypothetical protein ACJX0J_039511, partial [Zea mays]